MFMYYGLTVGENICVYLNGVNKVWKHWKWSLGTSYVSNCIWKPFIHVKHRHTNYFVVSVTDVVYTRCFCIEHVVKWTHGCPKYMTQVLACPPKKAKEDVICCAQIGQKDKKKKEIFKKRSILRLLRVFDG